MDAARGLCGAGGRAAQEEVIRRAGPRSRACWQEGRAARVRPLPRTSTLMVHEAWCVSTRVPRPAESSMYTTACVAWSVAPPLSIHFVTVQREAAEDQWRGAGFGGGAAALAPLAAMADAASSPPTPAQRRPRPPTEEPPPPWSFPPPRPLSERVVDYGILSGICGGTYGAMRAARHGSSTLIAALWVGGHWVLASSCFLGARELLIQDDWANDREGVSGMAAAITGGGFAGLYVGRKAIPRACAGFFVGGFVMHYAHRWCAPCLAYAQRTRTHLTPGVLPAPTGSFDYG